MRPSEQESWSPWCMSPVWRPIHTGKSQWIACGSELRQKFSVFLGCVARSCEGKVQTDKALDARSLGSHFFAHYKNTGGHQANLDKLALCAELPFRRQAPCPSPHAPGNYPHNHILWVFHVNVVETSKQNDTGHAAPGKPEGVDRLVKHLSLFFGPQKFWRRVSLVQVMHSKGPRNCTWKTTQKSTASVSASSTAEVQSENTAQQHSFCVYNVESTDERKQFK